jgi:hypothetical protein
MAGHQRGRGFIRIAIIVKGKDDIRAGSAGFHKSETPDG